MSKTLKLIYFTRPAQCPQCRVWEMVGITTATKLMDATFGVRPLREEMPGLNIDPGNPGSVYSVVLTQVIAPQSVPSLFLWDGIRAVQIAPRVSLGSTPSVADLVAIIREEVAKW